MLDEQLGGATRGGVIRTDLRPAVAPLPHEDKPWEFEPIKVQLSPEATTAFQTNKLQYRMIGPANQPLQFLVYRSEEIMNVEELNQMAHGSPLRERTILPKGIVWDAKTKQYIAMPVFWTDSLTGEIATEVLDKGVIRMTVRNKPEIGDKVEQFYFHDGDVYTKESWESAVSQAAQFAQQGLGLPAGSPATTPLEGFKPQPITWTGDIDAGSFQPDGVYSSPPGTRYGFMGWVRPKKN